MDASYLYINQSIKIYISLLINPDLRIDFFDIAFLLHFKTCTHRIVRTCPSGKRV